jgi:hypothetical protein
MPLTLTPITGSGRVRKNLEEIDPDTIQAIEDAFEYCTANPGHRLQTPAFATKDDADGFLSDARAYAYHRGETLQEGRLTVSGNPAKAPAGEEGFVVRFKVEPYQSGDVETAE